MTAKELSKKVYNELLELNEKYLNANFQITIVVKNEKGQIIDISLIDELDIK